MSQQLIRTVAILVVVSLIISGFAKLAPQQVQAAFVWRIVTDHSADYAIYDIVEDYGDYYYRLSSSDMKEIYMYDGAESSLISQDLIDNEDLVEVKQITFAGTYLYASLSSPDSSNLADELWKYDGEWTQVTLPEDTTNIAYIEEANSDVFAWIITNDGEVELTQPFFYDVNNGWENLYDAAVFGEYYSGQLGVRDIVEEGDVVYILAHNYSSGVGMFFAYNEDEGEWVGEFAPTIDDDLENMAVFDGEFYVGTHEYADEINVYKLIDGEWEEFETGLTLANKFTPIFTNASDYLYVALSRPGGKGEIYRTDGTDGWEIVSNFIGNEDESYGWVTSMIAYGDGLLVGAAENGEGPYAPILWSYLEGVDGGDPGPEPSPDSDGDGSPDTLEDEGPNDGDANDDGTPDSEQANVANFMNSITGKYSVLEHTCESTAYIGVGTEDDETPDAAFSYPTGLMNFTIECAVGETATIVQYHYGDYDAAKMIVRKFDYNTSTYKTIVDADLENISIGGQPVLKVSYQVTDGGDLDLDGEENGAIVDPAGPALNAAGVPNTGIGGLDR